MLKPASAFCLNGDFYFYTLTKHLDIVVKSFACHGKYQSPKHDIFPDLFALFGLNDISFIKIRIH